MQSKFSIFTLLFSILIFGYSCKNTNPQSETSEQTAAVETTTPIASDKVEEKHEPIGDMAIYTMSEIEKIAKKDKKKIIVDVYTDWCGPCKMMDARTFTDSEVQRVINERFHMVKFNAEGPADINFKGKVYGNPNHMPGKRGRNAPHQLADFFSVPGYPTLVVLDENFNINAKIVGFKTPEQLIEALGNI